MHVIFRLCKWNSHLIHKIDDGHYAVNGELINEWQKNFEKQPLKFLLRKLAQSSIRSMPFSSRKNMLPIAIT